MAVNSKQIDLTQKQADILSLVSVGLPNKQIARALRVSEQTIKNHIIRLIDKYNCNNRAGLTAIYLNYRNTELGRGETSETLWR